MSEREAAFKAAMYDWSINGDTSSPDPEEWFNRGWQAARRAEPAAPQAGSLSAEQVVMALKNIGYAVECGACMEIFYTGSTAAKHECMKKPRLIVDPVTAFLCRVERGAVSVAAAPQVTQGDERPWPKCVPTPADLTFPAPREQAAPVAWTCEDCGAVNNVRPNNCWNCGEDRPHPAAPESAAPFGRSK